MFKKWRYIFHVLDTSTKKEILVKGEGRLRQKVASIVIGKLFAYPKPRYDLFLLESNDLPYVTKMQEQFPELECKFLSSS